MDCDLLLSWMTHMGEGSWATFRTGVEELSGSDADLADVFRRLRVNFSDLGFADFFIEGTQRWRVLAPAIGGLAAQDSEAVFCGGRTPGVVDSLEQAATTFGCTLQQNEMQECPEVIHVTGEPEELSRIAKEIGVAYVPSMASAVLQSGSAIPEQMELASSEPEPRNWKVRSFNFTSRTWEEGLRANSACEYTPTYGYPKFFVHRKRKRLFRLPKREALYAAAMLKGVRLAKYDIEHMRLTTPVYAPLPELYARAACLCSGRPAQVADGNINYDGVTPDIAAIVMVGVGQPHPGVEAST